MPEVGFEVHAPVQREAHTFTLQQPALGIGIADAEVDAARSALLDDSLAWHPGSVRGAVHRPANDAGRAWGAEQPGDLPVGGHFPPRDLPDQGVDQGEEALPPLPGRSPIAGPPAGLGDAPAHPLPPSQRLPDLLGHPLALRVVGDEVNLVRGLCAETHLHGAGDLLLLEHRAA